MENFQENLNNENSLNDFHEEIKNIQLKEEEKKQDKANPDLMSIDPDDLNERDMEMWQWYKDLSPDNITKSDLFRIREYVYSIKNGNSSRNGYFSFLSDKVMGIWGKRELQNNKKSS
ncbi:MAG: hypothetical protein ABIG88_00395 [Patescibacteria group bacterium]|nr:hypothetical protein [Patescibacteria group bacterium]